MTFDLNKQYVFECYSSKNRYPARVVCNDVVSPNGMQSLALILYPDEKHELPIEVDQRGNAYHGRLLVERSFFVNIYRDGPEPTIFQTRKDADDYAFKNRIDCIEVKY